MTWLEYQKVLDDIARDMIGLPPNAPLPVPEGFKTLEEFTMDAILRNPLKPAVQEPHAK
jgi:hypothetical protein